MKTRSILICLLLIIGGVLSAAELLVEAESFKYKGGWVVDQQFMDQMGSPYLMAHGMGNPVKNAFTEVTFRESGVYYVYVRTFNWTSPWSDGEGAGRFKISVNGEELSTVLGATGKKWLWQLAGKIPISEGMAKISLQDLTGFNGRCDAIFFTTDAAMLPPSDMKPLNLFRKEKLGISEIPQNAGSFDLVVIGGGIAGMSAAVTAARLGVKVALIHDRPVLGGNNSSEVRVHLGGRIGVKPYKELGALQKEFGPLRGGNAQPGEFYEDDKKAKIIAEEENISFFPNYHAFAVEMNGNKIQKVIAKHIETGMEMAFEGAVFSDCTGDGTIGYLAGADYKMGRESKTEFNESTAPEQADKLTMGASVQWYSVDKNEPVSFPMFKYGLSFDHLRAEKVTMGEWTWETGMNYDQINDFERIRDYGLMVVYSNWSFLKNEFNENNLYKNRALEWVAFVSGKRESRRLLGDHILTENDLINYRVYPDGSGSTTWTIDLHYPDPNNTKYFPDSEFKSIAKHKPIHPYPVPYRCLYSRNIDNLFMAGRNISVTHIALGTVRVMRTTGILGEVVGMAASLCKKYGEIPRGIYKNHLEELKELMLVGVGRKELDNNQKYNEGTTLGD